MDILCSDKTGTLTLNKLTVDHVNCYPLSGHSIEEVRARLARHGTPFCRVLGAAGGACSLRAFGTPLSAPQLSSPCLPLPLPPPPPRPRQVLQYGAKSANIITEEPIDMVLHESYPNR